MLTPPWAIQSISSAGRLQSHPLVGLNRTDYAHCVIRIVALLGNPGSDYQQTRHNISWIFGDYCGWGEGDWRTRWGAKSRDVVIAGSSVHLVKPQNFMNRSGESLARYYRYYKIAESELLVVHDDVEIPFGEVRLKQGGGLAGHNGLRSLSERVGSRDFHRLRIGIGRPSHGTVSSYVLGKFSRLETSRFPDIFDAARALLESKMAAGA